MCGCACSVFGCQLENERNACVLCLSPHIDRWRTKWDIEHETVYQKYLIGNWFLVHSAFSWQYALEIQFIIVIFRSKITNKKHPTFCHYFYYIFSCLFVFRFITWTEIIVTPEQHWIVHVFLITAFDQSFISFDIVACDILGTQIEAMERRKVTWLMQSDCCIRIWEHSDVLILEYLVVFGAQRSETSSPMSKRLASEQSPKKLAQSNAVATGTSLTSFDNLTMQIEAMEQEQVTFNQIIDERQIYIIIRIFGYSGCIAIGNRKPDWTSSWRGTVPASSSAGCGSCSTNGVDGISTGKTDGTMPSFRKCKFRNLKKCRKLLLSKFSCTILICTVCWVCEIFMFEK